jgi:hypothetical protein
LWQLSLVEGLGHGSGDQGEVAWLFTAGPHAEATLCVATAGIQTIRTEVVPALIAAQQALAQEAFLAVMADGNVATFDDVQLAPVGDRRYAGKIQRNHGKSIQTWKLLPVAYT